MTRTETIMEKLALTGLGDKSLFALYKKINGIKKPAIREAFRARLSKVLAHNEASGESFGKILLSNTATKKQKAEASKMIKQRWDVNNPTKW